MRTLNEFVQYMINRYGYTKAINTMLDMRAGHPTTSVQYDYYTKAIELAKTLYGSTAEPSKQPQINAAADHLIVENIRDAYEKHRRGEMNNDELLTRIAVFIYLKPAQEAK